MKKVSDRLHAAVSVIGLVVITLTADSAFAQISCPTVDAGADTALCQTSPVQLNAGAGFDSYIWSPATGLNNPNIANPTASVSGTVTYTVTATNLGPDIITNGDFSMGDVGFTSEYVFMNYFYNPCYYAVGSDFFQTGLNPIDHSPSSDNMFMSVDGCMQVAILWEQTVTVDSFTGYRFSFWATRAGVNQPNFEVHFIGDVTGDVLVQTATGIPTNGTIFIWDEYGVLNWNSSANSTVTIRLVTTSTEGYGVDFCLDDISMQKYCTQSDSIKITLTPTPPPVMPPGTAVCQFASLPPLQAQGQNILWYSSPGAGIGNPQPPVPATGIADTTYIYYATQTVNGCVSSMGSTTISVIAPPFFDLGPSVTLCQVNSVSVGPQRPDWQYVWQDALSSSPRTISSTEPGLYILTAQNSCGQHTDSVSVFPPTPPPVMPPDSTVCQYASLPPLQAQGQNILWYSSPGTGIGHAQPPIPDTDGNGSIVYYATQTLHECESPVDSTTIHVIALPFFHLGEPVTLCEGNSIKVGPENPDWHYLWQDSLSDSPRVISSDEAGLYILTAQNNCGQHTDSISIHFDECLCAVFWPNVFSPNTDVYNEIFKPVYDCRLEEYDLRIFNRWGELIYESRNPDEGWNGLYNGQPATQGIYIMQLNYAGLSGAKKIHKSAVDKFTLIR